MLLQKSLDKVDWSGEWSNQRCRDRFSLMRTVHYEPSESVEEEVAV